PSATAPARNRRILCTPRSTASAAASRAPALRPYTPPVMQRGWSGSSLTERTNPSSPVLTYTGDSSSTYGVTASTMSAPSASWRSAPRYTACQSCGRITVSTMLQNTGPGATAWSPSTSVCSDEGVRHSITLRGRPNRVPSSTRRTVGKSARTAHVRLVHPRTSKVSSKRTTCGLPATCTRGLGSDPSPAVASREPSPPARIKPCTLAEDPFDVGKPGDARRGVGPRGLLPVWGRQPARPDTEPRGPSDVGLEVVAHHPGALRRRPAQRAQRLAEDPGIGFRRAHHGRVGDRREQPCQAQLVQTVRQIPREIRDDAQTVAARQPLEHPLVTCHDGACRGVKLLRHPPRLDLGPVGHELEQHLGLRLDHLPEAEPPDAAGPPRRPVGPWVDRSERRFPERPPSRPCPP